MLKSVLKYLLCYCLITIFLVLGVVYYILHNRTKILSPVLGASKIRFADNLWFPKDVYSSESAKIPHFTSEAAFFVDATSGQVLYEKNSRTKMRVASLTKIMSAVVALEIKGLTDTYSVSQRAADMEPDKMLLIAGERLTLDELLQGVFLVSANDAVEVIAEGTTTSREDFVDLMNKKAQQLGMKDTLFINPSGLEEDNPTKPGELKEQYSSAYDLTILTRYAIKRFPHLLEISSQPHIYIPRGETHQDYDLYSGINLLTTYPGVIGFKTGYTPEAGLTLVSIAKRSDKVVIGVLLGATDRRDDAKAMLDFSFKKLGV